MPGEPASATVVLPAVSYREELAAARTDAASAMLPRAWRGNPAALVGARIAATALHVPLPALIAASSTYPEPAEVPEDDPPAAGCCAPAAGWPGAGTCRLFRWVLWAVLVGVAALLVAGLFLL